jgi:hypothetical protein
LCLISCVAVAQSPDQRYREQLETTVRTNTFIRIQPSTVTNLLACPQSWTKITLDNTSLHLPLQWINSVTNRGARHVQFWGQKGFAIHLAQVDQTPVVPFSQAKTAELLTLEDLDKASPDKRGEILMMLECKAIKLSGQYKSWIVETTALRAFVTKCWMENAGEKVHITSCDVYSPDDKIGFLLMIRNEPNPELPFMVLQGISFTGKTMDRNRIIADIEKIRKKIAGGTGPSPAGDR